MARHPIRILGIDPGLRRTGWGLIESDGNRLIHIGCGSLETSEQADLGVRLLAIHDGLLAVIEQYRPHEAAVEATFVNANAAATLKLGQARGIAMLVPAIAGVPVAEYAPYRLCRRPKTWMPGQEFTLGPAEGRTRVPGMMARPPPQTHPLNTPRRSEAGPR